MAEACSVWATRQALTPTPICLFGNRILSKRVQITEIYLWRPGNSAKCHLPFFLFLINGYCNGTANHTHPARIGKSACFLGSKLNHVVALFKGVINTVFADNHAIVTTVYTARRGIDDPAHRNALPYRYRRIAVAQQGGIDNLYIVLVRQF